MERLLTVYAMKGRIDKNIYTTYIKPFLLRQKMKDFASLVECLKFVVCSECQDNVLLKSIYELLDIAFSRGELRNSRHLYDLHIYTHYLRVKGYTINLSKALEKELTLFCREKAEGRESLNRVVFDSKPIRTAITKGKTKYASDCLCTGRSALKEFTSTQRSEFEAVFKYKLLQLKLDEMKIYEKPVFCCF
jgi:hypothetical protein